MITITIKTDNAAFQDGNRGLEVARILRRLADEYANGYTNSHYPTHPRDINGNRCGTVTTTGKDR